MQLIGDMPITYRRYSMSSSQNALVLIARILLSFIFIYSGFGKLTDPLKTA